MNRQLLLPVCLALAGAFVAVESVASGQSSSVEWGRVGPGLVSVVEGGDTRTWMGTTYSGRADRVRKAAANRTWSGHVAVSFRESSITVLADEVSEDQTTNQLVFRGKVRIQMDVMGR